MIIIRIFFKKNQQNAHEPHRSPESYRPMIKDFPYKYGYGLLLLANLPNSHKLDSIYTMLQGLHINLKFYGSVVLVEKIFKDVSYINT
jgi:hypothetical protein